MTRIADSELAANVRSRNRVNSERRRQRLALAGKVQLLTWIPDTLRRELDSVAAARGEPVSETAAALLSLGLKQITTTTPATTTPYCCLRCDAPIPADCEDAPVCADCNRELNAIAESCNATTTPATKPTAPETADMFPAPAGNSTTRDELMTWIGKLLDEGHTGNDIARQLNASGQRTASGAAFTGQNILRDYRAWLKKTADEVNRGN